MSGGRPPPRDSRPEQQVHADAVTVVMRTALPAAPSAASQARRAVTAALESATVATDVDTVVLVVSELITNGYLHGRSPLDLRLTHRPGVLRIEVSDENSRMPELAPADGDALSGRGLHLVVAVSLQWGAEPNPVGKTVWAELAAK